VALKQNSHPRKAPMVNCTPGRPAWVCCQMDWQTERHFCAGRAGESSGNCGVICPHSMLSSPRLQSQLVTAVPLLLGTCLLLTLFLYCPDCVTFGALSASVGKSPWKVFGSRNLSQREPEWVPPVLSGFATRPYQRLGIWLTVIFLLFATPSTKFCAS
jgi:hypothetical protein